MTSSDLTDPSGEGFAHYSPAEAPEPVVDWQAYCERSVVERLINRRKQQRRIATRYEKRAANDLAMLTLVAIPLWL